MYNQALILFIYTLPFFIILFFTRKAGLKYFRLYKKKKHPDYPMIPEESIAYIRKDIYHFFKFFLTPFFWWKILFEKHSDRELNNAAKKVRNLTLLFYAL